jgi:putative transcriptional regulator
LENTIRVERAIINISQAELAEKIKVSRQTINAIENGKYIPSTLLALRIAKVFNKKVDDIFKLEKTDLV